MPVIIIASLRRLCLPMPIDAHRSLPTPTLPIPPYWFTTIFTIHHHDHFHTPMAIVTIVFHFTPVWFFISSSFPLMRHATTMPFADDIYDTRAQPRKTLLFITLTTTCSLFPSLTTIGHSSSIFPLPRPTTSHQPLSVFTCTPPPPELVFQSASWSSRHLLHARSSGLPTTSRH